MKLIDKKLLNVGINIPNILLPKSTVDMKKWATIACDQYTSDTNYWSEVEKYVGSSPSTFKLMLPEAYLDNPNINKVYKKINLEMKKYVRLGTLVSLDNSFILVERTSNYENTRYGIVTCVDLEKYDFNKNSQSLIRPTEETIVDRIPPRVMIREKASLEMPHIMLLIDDPDKAIIERFVGIKNSYKKTYDFELMQNGGKITGYELSSEEDKEFLNKELHELIEEENFEEKYETTTSPLLFAVGDGNHSLATAKQHWENVKLKIKNQDDLLTNPARYALVEIVNIHDEGLKFEPIHRVLFNTKIDDLIKHIESKYDIEITEYDDSENLQADITTNSETSKNHFFGIVNNDNYKLIQIKNSKHTICTGTVQSLLDDFISKNKVEIDFIHDTDSTVELSKNNDIGILLPPINKDTFFKTIIEEGTMPRKTFSMGHADEKRFYLETRKITL